jgi:hypothetical protein
MSVVSVETVGPVVSVMPGEHVGSVGSVEPVGTIVSVEPVVSVGPVVSVETGGNVVSVGSVEPVGPDEMSKKVKVPRTDGRITPGTFGGLYPHNLRYVVLTWVENGIDTEKMVPIIKFVELNPEYAYLLPQPQQIIFEFSQAQVAAFQECEDCPLCLKGINCDSDM